jgi:hypothetical protein
MRHPFVFLGAVSLAVGITGCRADPISPPQPSASLRGTWGGDGIEISVQAESAQVLYDCAQGRMEIPEALAADGSFAARGGFQPTAGPMPVGGWRTYPAWYEGRVAAGRMSIDVTRVDTGEAVGTFDLAHGRPGRLHRCR